MSDNKPRIMISTSDFTLSDLTGRRIEIGSIFMVLGNRLRFKYDELEDIKNLLRERPSKLKKLEANKRRDISKCGRCGDKYNYVTKLEKSGLNDKSVVLCEECAEKTINEIEDVIEVIDESVYLESNKGLTIHENNPIARKYRDFIDQKDLDENDIVISLVTGPENILLTKLENIEVFISILEDYDDYVTEATHMSPGRSHRCMSCDSDGKLKIIANILLCSDCVDDIRNLLESYLENNREEIVARTI